MKTIEKWGFIEIALPGRADGNPFMDYAVEAVFSGAHETVRVDGFYDGEGVYKVRFMPRYEGDYAYVVSGSFSDEKHRGTFTVSAPSGGNHGPVRVKNQHHFAYEDETPYYPVGTTCYTWAVQGQETREQALKNFAKGYFNKVRFALWRHGNPLMHYTERQQPHSPYPFTLTQDGVRVWDFERFDCEFYRDFEEQIVRLMHLGIEADLILLMPNERYGFQHMGEALTAHYLKYVLARFGAYRNAWWTLTNEYDFMEAKSLPEWNRHGQLLLESDPYRHLRSIHYWRLDYDYSMPWVTHCCIQSQNFRCVPGYADFWRQRYHKPVVLDEIAYEGNLDTCWGNLTGEEMTHRFWLAAITGGYASHGESYLFENEDCPGPNMRVGAKLYGTSPERIAFLHKILSETPGYGLKPLSLYDPVKMHEGNFAWDDPAAVPEESGYEDSYYLIYLSDYCPGYKTYCLDEANAYTVEVIDTWNMTIEPRGKVRGTFKVELPAKPYMAIRIRKDV